jgi:iron complex transport system substrate-binding protein
MISLYGAHTENLFSLGLDQEIIGVGRNDRYPPQAVKKTAFSYHDDPERFIAARPDLVLIRPMIDQGHSRFVKSLENASITVVSLQPGTVEEMFTYWRILGMLTGKSEEALRMTRVFTKTVEYFKTLTVSIEPKKKVYFEAIHDKMKTFTPESMPIFALQTAGGVNIAADAGSVRGTNIAYYGKERILSRGAEIEVYLAQRGTMNQPTVEMIRNETGFHMIQAVQKQQIGIVDEQIISRPTLRLLEGIREIGMILYPEVFSDPGVEKALKEFRY